jgi:hypothetical protein
MAVKLERRAVGVTWVEQNAMARAAHALVDGGRVWVIDPYEDAGALAAVSELGTPAGVLQRSTVTTAIARRSRSGSAFRSGGCRWTWRGRRLRRLR